MNHDIYRKIADEFQVTRRDVKQLAFSYMYGMGTNFGAPIENQIRHAVRTALKLGTIKKVTP